MFVMVMVIMVGAWWGERVRMGGWNVYGGYGAHGGCVRGGRVMVIRIGCWNAYGGYCTHGGCV